MPTPSTRSCPTGRLAKIHDNLIARIAEAECEGWLSEVEGLHVSLAGAQDKARDRSLASLGALSDTEDAQITA